MSQKKAELFSAWEWICPGCDRNNFASAITMDVTPDMMPAGIVCSDSPGFWVSQPENVTCQHCGAKFETDEGEEIELGGEG